jgi:hypothetical protein
MLFGEVEKVGKLKSERMGDEGNERAKRGFAQHGLSPLPEPSQVQRVVRFIPNLSACRLPRMLCGKHRLTRERVNASIRSYAR